MKILEVSSSQHSELIDITAELEALIPEGLSSGICHVYSSHTTAALTINENADPDVKHDILSALEKAFPWNNSTYNHVEGNSAAHVKASLTGFSVTVPFINSKLWLGTWQSVYLCEFDGPRRRRLAVQFIKDETEK